MPKRKVPPVPAGHKWCLGCAVALPFSAFPVSPSSLDGLAARCEDCKRAQRREAKLCQRIVAQSAQRLVEITAGVC